MIGKVCGGGRRKRRRGRWTSWLFQSMKLKLPLGIIHWDFFSVFRDPEWEKNTCSLAKQGWTKQVWTINIKLQIIAGGALFIHLFKDLFIYNTSSSCDLFIGFHQTFLSHPGQGSYC